jgi:hypothetical protein
VFFKKVIALSVFCKIFECIFPLLFFSNSKFEFYWLHIQIGIAIGIGIGIEKRGIRCRCRFQEAITWPNLELLVVFGFISKKDLWMFAFIFCMI